ncbi:DUF6504 family protein [Actinomadura rudentiformis]|uniref:Nucleotidyltransferase n=1 Tax=Actinomadura rudentiformis TaxID=359158 RepID=A0A6H9YWH3_9ACTN|nr:DUF6504 family protein [Actinomadura rudentiformis]KAB2350337.1 nucleotidyltransferase [Actinomadura rudentiformis]
MRVYNERITGVETDRIGRPLRWTWRRRVYRAGPVLDYWVTTRDWWREEVSLADGGSQPIRHWLVEASSAAGSGQAELALDEASMTWRLIGLVD